MAHLYVNPKGFEVTFHSYSGGETFRYCAQKYKLERLDGWKERENRASFPFGLAVEAAIKFHHDNRLSGGPEEFLRQWEKVKDSELTYTATEGSWENLAAMGTEMLKLYAVRLPNLPFLTNPPPAFQVPKNKEMFPGTDLGGIKFSAYIDMLVKTLNGHMVIDVKTSGMALDTTPGILTLDPQLRAYSWITGVDEVGFLWFTKTNRSVEKGSRVTLLEDVDVFCAGHELSVFSVEKQDFGEDILWVIPDAETLDAFEKRTKDLKPTTNAYKEIKKKFLDNAGIVVPKSKVTKQRMQFQTAHFTQADRDEIAQQIGMDIAQIVHANETNFWPKQGGIRFPNDKCTKCPMRGICLQNPELRDKMVFQKSDSTWETPNDEN